jgi:peroxiredoxin
MPHQQYNVNKDGDAPTFEQEQQQQHQGSYRDASSSHQLLSMTPRQFTEHCQPAPYHDIRQQQQNSFQSPP